MAAAGLLAVITVACGGDDGGGGANNEGAAQDGSVNCGSGAEVASGDLSTLLLRSNEVEPIMSAVPGPVTSNEDTLLFSELGDATFEQEINPSSYVGGRLNVFSAGSIPDGGEGVLLLSEVALFDSPEVAQFAFDHPDAGSADVDREVSLRALGDATAGRYYEVEGAGSPTLIGHVLQFRVGPILAAVSETWTEQYRERPSTSNMENLAGLVCARIKAASTD